MTELLSEIYPDFSKEFKTECRRVLLNFKKQIHEKYPYTNPECNLRELTHVIEYRVKFDNTIKEIGDGYHCVNNEHKKRIYKMPLYKFVLLRYLISINETILQKCHGTTSDGLDTAFVTAMIRKGYFKEDIIW